MDIHQHLLEVDWTNVDAGGANKRRPAARCQWFALDKSAVWAASQVGAESCTVGPLRFFFFDAVINGNIVLFS